MDLVHKSEFAQCLKSVVSLTKKCYPVLEPDGRSYEIMKTNEVVRALMDKNGIRFNQFAEMLGLKPNALASRMKRGNFSTDVLGEMLGQLGYKLVMVPVEEPIADGWYDVERMDTPIPGLDSSNQP